MASQVTPKKNAAYTFFTGLISQADTKLLQGSATLAVGDVKVSTDGGAMNNITTLPVVTPAASKSIKVDLSAAEMNGDNIVVIFSDAVGAEWCDAYISIQTSTRQMDDMAFPAVSGRSIAIDASGNVVLQAVTHTGAVVPTVTTLTNDAGITQAGADKVWLSASRTLTAFSTALALSVWDVLTASIVTANSIGLLIKTNLDAVLSAIKAKTDSLTFTVANLIDANILRLNGVAASAQNLEKSASVIYRGSVTGVATTTTLIDSALTQANTDHWKGRIVIFTSGALTYQATDITAFDPALDKLTFTALTNAPAGADTYVIV